MNAYKSKLKILFLLITIPYALSLPRIASAADNQWWLNQTTPYDNNQWWMNQPGPSNPANDIQQPQAAGAVASPSDSAANPIISVGLVSRGQTPVIPFASTALNVGFYLNGGFTTEATLNSASFTAQAAPSANVRIAQNIPSHAEALATAQGLATHHAVPMLQAPGLWSVYLTGFATTAEAQDAATLLGASVSALSPYAISILDTDNNIILLLANESHFAHLADPSGITTIDSGRYRGVIKPRLVTNGLTAVNLVPLEDYLISVVPSEMPSSWPLQALKAQAVAARTYALSNVSSPRNPAFQLVDTVMSQVYRGVEAETESTTRAVRETAGVRAKFNGRYINAVYFSSSGGRTENSENVWLEAVPYLRSVPERHESGYRQWYRNFSMDQLSQLMAPHGIGSVTGLSYTAAYPSGRIIELSFIGTSGKRTYSGDSIRTAFSSAPGGSLESNNFTVSGASRTTSQLSASHEAPSHFNSITSYGEIISKPVHYISGLFGSENILNPSPSIPGILQQISPAYSTSSSTIQITGRGWGHGVGMSQFGARGMAEAGYSFEQILKHYYTGIELVR